MTQLRATSIIFFSALLIIYKKPFIYFLSILLASSFHVFALTALPLYWIARSKYLKKIIIIGIVASVIIYLSGGILTVIINNTVADPFSYLHYKLTGYIEGDKNISVNAFGLGNIFYLGIISYGIYTNENMLYKILLLYMAFGVYSHLILV